MGFSNGAYAKIWDIKISDDKNYANVRINISRKVKDTEEYRQTFGGYVRFAGNAFEKVKCLQSGARVQLTRVDVENSYDKEKKFTTYYLTVWDIEQLDTNTSTATPTPVATSDDDADIPF